LFLPSGFFLPSFLHGPSFFPFFLQGTCCTTCSTLQSCATRSPPRPDNSEEHRRCQW
jgi:hypothetical protein